MHQYSDMNLRAALSEGGGRMWPPGRQLPTPDLYSVLYLELSVVDAAGELLKLLVQSEGDGVRPEGSDRLEDEQLSLLLKLLVVAQPRSDLYRNRVDV